MHDWGFEASLGYFVLRSELELYLRQLLIVGPFAKPVEGSVGANWYPFDTRQVWLNVEAIGIKDSPYGGGLLRLFGGADGLLASEPVPAALLRSSR